LKRLAPYARLIALPFFPSLDTPSVPLSPCPRLKLHGRSVTEKKPSPSPFSRSSVSDGALFSLSGLPLDSEKIPDLCSRSLFKVPLPERIFPQPPPPPPSLLSPRMRSQLSAFLFSPFHIPGPSSEDLGSAALSRRGSSRFRWLFVLPFTKDPTHFLRPSPSSVCWLFFISQPRTVQEAHPSLLAGASVVLTFLCRGIESFSEETQPFPPRVF